MKSLKKVLAVLVATAMVAGMGVMAFGDPTNNMMKYDGTLEVQGLTSGATVTFYQILKWDQTHSGTGGWVVGPDYDGAMDDDYIVELIGSGTNPTPGITYENASKIASKLKNGSGVSVGSDGKAIYNISSKSGTGLYVAVITPADSEQGVIYNPVFVSSNWYKSGTSGVGHNVWNLSGASGTNPSYNDNPQAVAKKKILTVDKEITSQEHDNDSGTAQGSGTPANLEPDALESGTSAPSYHAANAGDVIGFEIKTSVPVFGKNYTDPIYVLTDTLDQLLLSGTPVIYRNAEHSGTLVEGTHYTYSGTVKDGKNVGYTITFLPNTLWRSGTTGIDAGPQDIFIVYNAVIDPSGTFTYNVNEKDNTIKINYSNNPASSGSSGTLKDRTKNYVFSIDANILGAGVGLGSGTEIVKVALDADGNELMSGTTVQLNSGSWELAPLEGAEFTLKSLGNSNYITRTVSSDAQGRILMEGIDAGWYSLVETNAPDGYVKDSSTYYILIEPTYEKTHVDATADEAAYDYDRLVCYDVYVGTIQDKAQMSKTAHYTVTDNGSGTSIEKTELTEFAIGYYKPIDKDDLPTSGSRKGKIQNTQGVALPSTGGIGTTLFYAGGAILVLLAGILLVSKRRIA